MTESYRKLVNILVTQFLDHESSANTCSVVEPVKDAAALQSSDQQVPPADAVEIELTQSSEAHEAVKVFEVVAVKRVQPKRNRNLQIHRVC